MIVIDYRQLRDKINNPPYPLYSSSERQVWLDECITTAKPFDAELVKHAKWERDCEQDKCTNCGKSLEDLFEGEFYYDLEELHFCPNCGARMDLKDGDNK